MPDLLPVPEDNDLVCRRQHLLQFMGDVYNDITQLLQAADRVKNDRAVLFRQCGGRFIQYHHLALDRQCTYDRHQLLVRNLKLPKPGVCIQFQIQHLQQFPGPLMKTVPVDISALTVG